MRVISLAIVSAALSIAAPAAAKTNVQATDRAAAGQSAKKICKKLEVTGSRMGERVCLTKQQWKQVEQDK